MARQWNAVLSILTVVVLGIAAEADGQATVRVYKVGWLDSDDVAKRAIATIPIVMTDLKQDPVKAGLVASLGRPGGNVTGLSSQSDELWDKRLGLLKEATPRVSRIIVVSNGMDLGNASCPLEIRRAARGLELEVVDLGFSREWGLGSAVSIGPRNPGDAVAVCWDDVTLKHAQAIGSTD